MNKSESKYFNTALHMDKALIELLEIKDIDYISVKEVCKAAGINRSTFYLHYDGIADLLEEAAEYTNQEFLTYFKDSFKNSQESNGIPSDLTQDDLIQNDLTQNITNLPLNEINLFDRKYLLPYLNFIEQNKSIFKASLKHPKAMQADAKFSSLREYVFEPILDRFNIPQENQNYVLAFYFGAVIAVIKEWLKNDYKDLKEQVAGIIESCVKF